MRLEHRNPLPTLACVLGLMMAMPAWSELPSSIHSIEVLPGRDYGITMGEVLSSEIRIRTEAGYGLATADLPKTGGSVSDFLELREIHWSNQRQGSETLHRLYLKYQVFKGVRAAETLAVPALKLRFGKGGEAVEAEAPAWNFTLSPLIPSDMSDESVILRGDLPPPYNPQEAHERWLAFFLSGLLGLGIFAFVRLAGFRRSPFLQAAKALKKLGRQEPSLENWREGAKQVHQALNASAGMVIFAGQLEGFLAEHPRYSGARSELEIFFELSDRLFFDSRDEPPAEYPMERLEKLCLRLAAFQ